MSRLDLSRTDVIDRAMGIILTILENYGAMPFHELLRRFNELDPEKHIVICDILTIALIRLKAEGKIKKFKRKKRDWYKVAKPLDLTAFRGIILIVTFVLALFIMRLLR